uniref:Uncharacterized protein n=1 Tax=Chloracidobacterium thermophilum TaxID=458033 RepID=A8DJI1_9BACT|nr:hypothetical protein YS_M60-F11.074 [Chloracidobacterium thermophilum]
MWNACGDIRPVGIMTQVRQLQTYTCKPRLASREWAKQL